MYIIKYVDEIIQYTQVKLYPIFSPSLYTKPNPTQPNLT